MYSSLITEMTEKKIASNTMKVDCTWVGKNVLNLSKQLRVYLQGLKKMPIPFHQNKKEMGGRGQSPGQKPQFEKCRGLEVERPNGVQKPKIPHKLRGRGREKQGKKGGGSCKMIICWNLGV